jgi:hypothetical protein
MMGKIEVKWTMRYLLSAFSIGLILVLLAISPAMGIKVTGVVYVTDVTPGEHIEHQMTVDVGDTGEPVDIVAQLSGCGMALDGSRVPLPINEDTSPYSATGFLKITPERVSVVPGTNAMIVLDGTVPQDVGTGGRYALVNIATVPKSGEQIGVSSAVEIPVFLTINGTDLIETGEITDINVTKSDDGGLLVGVMFNNTGNHHYKANAMAILKDDKGNVVSDVSVPSENSILPTYKRFFTIPFGQKNDLSQGIYAIEVSVAEENGVVLDSKKIQYEA